MKSPGPASAVYSSLSPQRMRAPPDDIEDRFDGPMMVRARFGIGMDDDGPGPDLLRACSRVGDGRRPGHARRLRRVRVELGALHHPDTLLPPDGSGELPERMHVQVR